jgi:hypothetical protein
VFGQVEEASKEFAMCFTEWDLRMREQQGQEVGGRLAANTLHEVCEHHRLEMLTRQRVSHQREQWMLVRQRTLRACERLTKLLREAVNQLRRAEEKPESGGGPAP